MIEFFSWSRQQTYKKIVREFAELKLVSEIIVRSSDSKFLKKHMIDGELGLKNVIVVNNWGCQNYNIRI